MSLTCQTKARLCNPKDCSVHVGSRSLFDHTTAVSTKHIKPYHLPMCLQQWRSACVTKPTCPSAGFDFQDRPTLSYDCIPLQRAEIRYRLLLGLRIRSGGLKS